MAEGAERILLSSAAGEGVNAVSVGQSAGGTMPCSMVGPGGRSGDLASTRNGGACKNATVATDAIIAAKLEKARNPKVGLNV